MNATTTLDDEALAGMYAPAGLDEIRAWLLGCGFDAAGYLKQNPQLAAAGLDEAGALDYYLREGVFQFRAMPIGTVAPHIRRLLELGIERKDVLHALIDNLTFVSTLHDQALAGNWDIDVKADIRPLPRLGAQPLLMIGDSHIKTYLRCAHHEDRLIVPFFFLCTASSAQGLGNPQSRARSGPKVAALMERLRGLPVFFKFGQVDAEFVSVFHRVREGQTRFRFEDFEAFARRSVERYGAFLAGQATGHGARLIRVCAIFPPVLSDEAWQEGYVNGHVGHLEMFEDIDALSRAIAALELPDLATRTRMHEVYNVELRAMCARKRFTFVDDFTPLLSDGIVRADIAGHGRDHHVVGAFAAGPAMAVAAPLTEIPGSRSFRERMARLLHRTVYARLRPTEA